MPREKRGRRKQDFAPRHEAIPPVEKTGVDHRIAAVALAAIVIALASIALLLPRSETPQPEIVPINITPPVLAPEECTDDECLLQLALQNQNPTICDLIAGNESEQRCYEQLAPTRFEACEKVTDYDKRKECAWANARLENSVRPCQHIGLTDEDRQACTLHIDECYYQNESERRTCHAISRSNVTYCENGQECVIQYARAKKDPYSCQQILGSGAVQYLCVSLATGVASCQDLSGEFERDYCYELYAKRTNQIGYCGNVRVTKDTDYQWRCYAYFAVREQDLALCNNVDLLRRWNCYTNYSLETGKTDGCVGINYAAYAKTSCFFDLAMMYGNPGVCEKITDAAEKSRCYAAVIYGYQRPIALEYCHPVTVDSWKNACYGEVAKITGNVTICDTYVSNEGERQLCEQRALNQKMNVTPDDSRGGPGYG